MRVPDALGPGGCAYSYVVSEVTAHVSFICLIRCAYIFAQLSAHSFFQLVVHIFAQMAVHYFAQMTVHIFAQMAVHYFAQMTVYGYRSERAGHDPPRGVSWRGFSGAVMTLISRIHFWIDLPYGQGVISYLVF